MKYIKYTTLALISLIITSNTMLCMKKTNIQELGHPIIEKKFKKRFCRFYVSPNFQHTVVQKEPGYESTLLYKTTENIDSKEDIIIAMFNRRTTNIVFSPNSKFLTIKSNGTIMLHNLENENMVLFEENPAYKIHFTPDSKHLILHIERNHVIQIFDIEILLSYINPSKGFIHLKDTPPIFEYTFVKYKKISPDGQYLLISHDEKNHPKTELVNLHTRNTIKTFTCKNFAQAHFSKDSKQLVICEKNDSYVIFDIHNNEITEHKTGVNNNFSKFQIKNKNFDIITNWNYLIKAFKLGKKEANKLSVCLQFSPDLRYMAKISSKKINGDFDTDDRDIDEEKIELRQANKNKCVTIRENNIESADEITFIQDSQNNNLLCIFKYRKDKSIIYTLADNLTKKFIPTFENDKRYACNIIENKNKKYLVVSFQRKKNPKEHHKSESGYKIFDLDTFYSKTKFEKKLCADTQYQDIHIVTKK